MVLNDGHRYNRRLGTRAAIAGAQVSWQPILARKRFSRVRYPVDAELVDLSITGASIRALADPRIRTGTQVVVEVGSAQGVVRVRRIEETVRGDEAIYGVEFLQSNEALTKLIHDTVGARRPQDLVWRWHHAR